MYDSCTDIILNSLDIRRELLRNYWKKKHMWISCIYTPVVIPSIRRSVYGITFQSPIPVEILLEYIFLSLMYHKEQVFPQS